MAIEWLSLSDLTGAPQLRIANASDVVHVGTNTLTNISVGSGGDHEGAWAFIVTFFERTPTGTVGIGGTATPPAGTDGSHPSTITVRNLTETSGPAYATATGAGGWIDFGYARGGYNDRNYLSIWGKVVTQDDIIDDSTGFRAEIVHSTTITVQDNATVISRLFVVLGAKTDTTTQVSVGDISRAFMNEVPETVTGNVGSAADSPDKIVFPKGTAHADYDSDFLGSSFMSIWAGATPRNSANIALGGTSSSSTFNTSTAGNGPEPSVTGSMTAQDGGSNPGPSASTYSGGLTCPAPNDTVSPVDDYSLWHPAPDSVQGSSTTYGGFVNNNRSSMSSVLFFKNFTAFTDFDDPWDTSTEAYAFDVATDTLYGSVSGVVLLPEAVVGGTVNESSLADSKSASDVLARELEALRSLSDSKTISDVLARELEAVRSLVDSATASDALSYEKLEEQEAALADSATAADVLAAVKEVPSTLADTATASDALSYEKLEELEASLSGTATASDALVRELEAVRSLVDSTSTVDALAYEKLEELEASLSDSATASDALVRELEALRSLSEIATASDALSYEQLVEREAALSDTATASDALAGELEAVRSLSGSASASDALVRELEAIRSLSDTATSADALSYAKTGEQEATLSDTATASDALAAVKVVGKALSDTATASDALSYAKSLEQEAILADTATASDALARELETVRSIANSVAASDVLVRELEALRSLVDIATSADALSYELPAEEAVVESNLVDSTTSGDSLDPELEYLRSISGTASASDALAYLAETPSGGTKRFGTIDIVASGYATEVGGEVEAILVEPSVVVRLGFTLQNYVVPLIPNEEGPGNLVTHLDIAVIATAQGTPSKGIVIASTGVGGPTGLDMSFCIDGSGGVTADGGADGPKLIILPLEVPLYGSTTADAEGGAGYNPLVLITGRGAIDGTLNARWLEQSAKIDGKGSVVSNLLTNGELMSVEEIWNTALVQLGVTTVTSTGDQSPQATLLLAVWNGGFRTKFLSDHTWNGGKRTAKLVKYVDNPTGLRWNYAFTLPSDYIRAYRVNGKENVPNSFNAASIGGSGGHNLWEVEVVSDTDGNLARCLLTDESELYLEYIFDVGDINIDLLGAMTKWAMGLALAAHAAPNFGKSPSDMEMMEMKAQEALVAAKGIDGQEGTPQMFQSTSLLDCRY